MLLLEVCEDSLISHFPNPLGLSSLDIIRYGEKGGVSEAGEVANREWTKELWKGTYILLFKWALLVSKRFCETEAGEL